MSMFAELKAVDVKVQGVVLENLSHPSIPNNFLRLQTDQNQYITVMYHSEFPPAINTHAGDTGFGLSEGDAVEVYAEALAQDALSTCECNRYYIRVLN